MNNNYQAKNGFKTFIITLSVSIFVFSSIYYLVAQGFNKDTTETSIEAAPTTTTQVQQNLTGDSVFGEISKKSMENVTPQVAGASDEKPQVLAGSDVNETTQSTVPDTGSNTMFVAFVIAMSAIALGAYVFLIGPRKFALGSFEKRVIKEL